MKQDITKCTKKEFKIGVNVIAIVHEVTKGEQVETLTWNYKWVEDVLTYTIPYRQSLISTLFLANLQLAMRKSINSNKAWEFGLNLEQMKEVLISQGFIVSA